MEFKRLAEESWKALFHALFEHSTEALFVLDSAGRILDLNRLASDSLGRSREELIGRCPVEFDTCWQQALPQGVHASPGCSTVSFQTTHRRKDGTEFPVDARVVPVEHEGQRLALFFASRHVSVSASRRLTDSERRLEAAQCIAAVGWWERDFLTGDVLLSDQSSRIFGVQPVDMPQWHGRWLSLIHPDDRARTAAAVEAALKGGPRYDVEYRIVRPDGALRVVHSQGDVTWDESGRPVRQFGVMQDITELRQAEGRLEAAQRIAHVGWWERDYANSRVLFSNEMAEINGMADRDRVMDLAEWLKLLPSIVHPEDWPRVFEASKASLRGGPRYDVEYRVVRADGTMRVVHSQADVTWDESGRPVRQFGVMQDITELRQAEEALRASEARFRTFVDRATDAFFLLDEQITVVDVNRQACENLGYSREELIGMHPRQFDAALSERAIQQVVDRVGAGGVITFETVHRRRDGTLFPVEIRTATFHQEERLFYIALARDISERKRAEETVRAKDQALQAARGELARVSRVMTLGELTASIAHEVNQPLAAMVANAAATMRWLAADPPQTDKARRVLQSIADDGRRAGEVIHRIRALVQRRPAHMSPVSVNDAIADVIALAQQELRSNRVVLSRLLAEDLPCVLGDRIQLQQVLLNLVVNAVEAMGAVKDRPRELTIASRLDGPAGVLVEVRDTGPGLEREHADHLFEAFYTTKSEGLGIGLSISRSIIEVHGGRLTAAQNIPHGAIFRFTLPVQGEAGA